MVLLAHVQVVREVNIKGWNYAHVLDRAVEREALSLYAWTESGSTWCARFMRIDSLDAVSSYVANKTCSTPPSTTERY